MTALILMRSWLSYLREQRAKVHALPGLQWIFPESYCNSGVIPLKYAYLPFPSILGITIGFRKNPLQSGPRMDFGSLFA